MLSPDDLPNDIDALKALLLASERLLQERDEQLAGMAEQLNTRAVEIEHLKLQIAKLRRMQFGRKSEKLDHQIEQLELQLEDLQAGQVSAVGAYTFSSRGRCSGNGLRTDFLRGAWSAAGISRAASASSALSLIHI